MLSTRHGLCSPSHILSPFSPLWIHKTRFCLRVLTHASLCQECPPPTSSFSHVPWVSPAQGGFPRPLHPKLLLFTISFPHGTHHTVSVLWRLTVCRVHFKLSYAGAMPALLCSLPSTPGLARVSMWPGHRHPSLPHSECPQAEAGSHPSWFFPAGRHSAQYTGDNKCLLKTHTCIKNNLRTIYWKNVECPPKAIYDSHTGRVACLLYK